jgi:hypothetical protein
MCNKENTVRDALKMDESKPGSFVKATSNFAAAFSTFASKALVSLGVGLSLYGIAKLVTTESIQTQFGPSLLMLLCVIPIYIWVIYHIFYHIELDRNKKIEENEDKKTYY